MLSRFLLTRSPLLLAATLAFSGCASSSYVRGSQVEGIDDPAMGTGLDKRDIQQLLHENLKSLMASQPAAEWQASKGRPTFAIYPLANETSEHIDSQLGALLSDIETFMVGTQLVAVVALDKQQRLIADVEKQQGGAFDRRNVAEYSRQLGAKVYLTGKVFGADERAAGERRVQYFMFMQLIDVSTGAILWQNKSHVTKALVRD